MSGWPGLADARIALLVVYAEQFPAGQAVSEDDARHRLLRSGVPRAYLDNELADLVGRGMLRHEADGTYVRPLQRRDPEPATLRDDNPEYAGFRAGVLKIVDERLRELGLIA